VNAPIHPTTDQERGDAIHVASLSRESFLALRELSERREWPELFAWMQPGDTLVLIERLKRAEDTDETFPKGKWATIQRLQQIFEDCFWGANKTALEQNRG
jgi:hypothetical protein